MTIKKTQQSSSTVWLNGKTYNSIADHVNKIDARTERPQRAFRIPRQVRVQNSTSTDIPIFSPVVLGDPITLAAPAQTDASYRQCLCYEALETNSSTKVMGITQQPVDYDAYGSGQSGVGEIIVSGITNATINVTDANHQYARCTSTPFELESCHDRTSVEILYSEVGTAKLCKVHLNPQVQTLAVGKTTQQISAGGNGTVEIYRDGAATGEEVTAELDWMTSQNISSGKEVLLNYFYDEFLWRIIGAECEDSVGSTVFQLQNDTESQTLTTSYALVPGMTVLIQSGDGVVPTAMTLSYSENWGTLNTSTAVNASPAISGASGSVAYSISSGALPAGLTIAASTGIISGVPTTNGSGSFVVRGIDSLGQEVVTSSQNWTVGTPVTITLTYPYNWANISTLMPVNFAANITGATAPNSFTVLSGSLPSGLSLNATTGDITGQANFPGSGSVSIRVTDSTTATGDSPVYNWNVT